MADQHGIDIIIINYFSVNKVIALLESIDSSAFDKAFINIIIISNSQENELDSLRNKTGISVIANEKNMGFGFACNQSLPYCKHEYVLLLNPDTILKKDTLKKAVDYISSYRSITVLGVKHLDTKGNTVASCSRFPRLKNHINEITGLSKINPRLFKGASLMYDFDHLASKYVNQVMGAFMMIRKSYIDEYAFMDTRFFVFGEDMDFCKRVWLNKEKVYYNAGIEIIHEGKASTEGIDHKKLCYSLEAKLIYAYKYFTRFSWFILVILTCLAEPFTRLIFAAIQLNWQGVKNTVSAYAMFYTRRNFK